MSQKRSGLTDGHTAVVRRVCLSAYDRFLFDPEQNMSAFLVNVLALAVQWGPQLAALATSFPKIFKWAQSALTTFGPVIEKAIPALAPFLGEAQTAVNFVAAHSDEIVADGAAFFAGAEKLLTTFAGTDVSKLTRPAA
jgi:hypothetical protein